MQSELFAHSRHIIYKEHKQGYYMKKLIGFVAVCIAAGMLFMLFLANRFIGLVLIVLLLLIGYNFFCCD